MNVSKRLREWLQIAFTEPVDRLNERYFFDKLACEFYSIFITDYFLADPNSAEDYTNSPYSKNELEMLSSRIDRQEDNDPSIIVVPSLTVKERKEMMRGFLNEHHLHNKELENLIEQENGRTNLDFNQCLLPELVERWQRFKWDFVQTKIDSFCNFQGISLESVTLWTDKKLTSVTFNLNEQPKEVIKEEDKTSAASRPWWKFW